MKDNQPSTPINRLIQSTNSKAVPQQGQFINPLFQRVPITHDHAHDHQHTDHQVVDDAANPKNAPQP